MLFNIHSFSHNKIKAKSLSDKVLIFLMPLIVLGLLCNLYETQMLSEASFQVSLLASEIFFL